MDLDKRRSLHRLKGTAILTDQMAEVVCYLLARGVSQDDVQRLQGVTAEQIETYRQDLAWQRRHAFLKGNEGYKNSKKPKNHDQYKSSALSTLYNLSREGEPEHRIKAAVELGKLSHQFQQQVANTEPQAPAGDQALLSKFKGDK